MLKHLSFRYLVWTVMIAGLSTLFWVWPAVNTRLHYEGDARWETIVSVDLPASTWVTAGFSYSLDDYFGKTTPVESIVTRTPDALEIDAATRRVRFFQRDLPVALCVEGRFCKIFFVEEEAR